MRGKKILAAFLCFCMVLSAGGFTTFAKEPTGVQTYEVEQQDATGTDAVTVVEEDAQTPLLNFMVVESDYVSTPGTLYVLADAGTEGIEIAEATLTYTNRSNGSSYQKQVDTILGTSMLFNLDFSDKSYAGVYDVTALELVAGGVTYSIDVTGTGISAAFGVDKTCDSEPDAWITEDASSDIVSTDGVIVNDVNGNDLSSGEIAQAVAEVAPKGQLRTSDDGKYVIVLDPGHGNGDPGATYTWNNVTYTERDINLKIALACKNALAKYNVTVYMTRTTNEGGLSMSDGSLVQYAADCNADILVSIHNNSSTNSETNGSEVYYPNSNYNADVSATGKGVAEKVLSKLQELGLTNRGAKIRNSGDNTQYPDESLADYYGVIRQSKLKGFPGIIIEHAFVSNQSDCEKYLGSDEMLKKIGEADAAALVEYFGLSENDNIYNGVDYSAVYDYTYYITNNQDVKTVYGEDKQAVLGHFVNYGMNEGRQASSQFNVYYYRDKYSDLRTAFGDSLQKYYMHFITNGKSEGRVGADGTTPQPTPQPTPNPTPEPTPEPIPEPIPNTATVYEDVDYKLVYDYAYYTTKYPDIKNAFGDDDVATLKHFVTQGMSEGRRGCAGFDVNSYRERYTDLQLAFGSYLPSYYNHYITYGYYEGRITTGGTSGQKPAQPQQPTDTGKHTTVYEGYDYSLVYDYTFYTTKYPDIKNAFGDDDEATLKHFATQGVYEGRQGSANFNVCSYIFSYADLRAAFGSNLPQYYYHYISYGSKEGRVSTGVSKLQNPVTVYDGVDYSAVYDFNYYVTHNATVMSSYRFDDYGALKYFVDTGMANGDIACEWFSPSIYKKNYSDLEAAFGDSITSYYYHYMNYGIYEGRIAGTKIYTDIMGSSTTTVAQMVAYYNANATYPAYYSTSDAPTIEAFCQLYLDECNAEGVDAAVAFCQAMKETGYLGFGGDVKIEQYNFAGLGATGNGVAGESFASVQLGIRAQVQHLKAYASTNALVNTCVDSRFQYVTRGSAKYVEWLGIKENPTGKGWATAEGYGESIVKDYMNKLKTY